MLTILKIEKEQLCQPLYLKLMFDIFKHKISLWVFLISWSATGKIRRMKMANIILGQTGVFILVMIEKPKRIGIVIIFHLQKYQVNYNYNIINGWAIIFKT